MAVVLGFHRSLVSRTFAFWAFGAVLPVVLSVPTYSWAQNCLNKGESTQSFQDAKRDASQQDACERATSLIRITKSNPDLVWQGNRVLMLSWLRACHRSAEPTSIACLQDGADAVLSEPEDSFKLWFTAVPEVSTFLARQPAGMTATKLVDRLKQFLGLNTADSYDSFVEVWVDPRDLMRPCQDPSIETSSCDLIDRSRPIDKKLKYHLVSAWPFTGLGYTYDWGSLQTDIGASEFVVKDGARVVIKRIVATDVYIRESLKP